MGVSSTKKEKRKWSCFCWSTQGWMNLVAIFSFARLGQGDLRGIQGDMFYLWRTLLSLRSSFTFMCWGKEIELSQFYNSLIVSISLICLKRIIGVVVVMMQPATRSFGKGKSIQIIERSFCRGERGKGPESNFLVDSKPPTVIASLALAAHSTQNNH